MSLDHIEGVRSDVDGGRSVGGFVSVREVIVIAASYRLSMATYFCG